jgi:hypothetical protein
MRVDCIRGGRVFASYRAIEPEDAEAGEGATQAVEIAKSWLAHDRLSQPPHPDVTFKLRDA